MKGKNTLEINTATMLGALQAWCDVTFTDKVVVLTCREKAEANVIGGRVYVLDLDVPEAPKTP